MYLYSLTLQLWLNKIHILLSSGQFPSLSGSISQCRHISGKTSPKSAHAFHFRGLQSKSAKELPWKKGVLDPLNPQCSVCSMWNKYRYKAGNTFVCILDNSIKIFENWQSNKDLTFNLLLLVGGANLPPPLSSSSPSPPVMKEPNSPVQIGLSWKWMRFSFSSNPFQLGHHS